MSEPGTPTLDQLKVLLTVAETGSFAAAARRLYRATSVVSYAIANLESQLGVELFDRVSTRKPQLTEAGRMVLAEAQSVYDRVDGLRARVRALQQGLEVELDLVFDVMFPAERMVDALKAFRVQFPTVTLRLHVEALGAVIQRVLDGEAALGVAGPLARRLDGLERIALGSTRLIPLAAPGHPLTAGGCAREHIQLVLSDRSALTRDQQFAVSATQTWRLADLGAKHRLMREGIGWGNLPEPMAREDLASGRLVQLQLPDCPPVDYPFQAIHRRDDPPGPARRWLIERLLGQTADA